MAQKMLIETIYGEETRLSVVKDGVLEKFDFESPERKNHKGNIYLAKIKHVEPSLQAAFVDYGAERHGFLPFSEIHNSYYRIPVGDRREADIPPVEDAEEVEATDEDSDADKDNHQSDADKDHYQRGRRSSGRRSDRPRYRIQDVIQQDQIILVQLNKEERGTKGAAFTSRISLPGRYCVLMTNSSRGSGISRKIEDVAERKDLRSIFADLDVPEGMAVIIRTAGRKCTKTEVKRDFEYLLSKWDEIRETTLHSEAPKLIYEDGALIQRAVRDIYQRDITEILVDSEEGYKSVRKALSQFIPSHVRKVKHYQDEVPLFQKFDIESQIEATFTPLCPLKSGGYLVINVTEAIIAIDVNSGRSTKQRNIEDTALEINLEAAWEAARQLRLRNLAGLIVIDFIDMMKSGNNTKVEKALAEALKEDRSRIQTSRISTFGLLEMSRQRMGPSLVDRSTVLCSQCEGLGRMRLNSSQALQGLRSLTHHASKNPSSEVRMFAQKSVLDYLLNDKRSELTDLERQHNVQINIQLGTEEDGVFRIEGASPDGGERKSASGPSRAPRRGAKASEDRKTIYESHPQQRRRSRKDDDEAPASSRDRRTTRSASDREDDSLSSEDEAALTKTNRTRSPGTRATGTRSPGTRATGTRATGTRSTGTRSTGTRATGTRSAGTGTRSAEDRATGTRTPRTRSTGTRATGTRSAEDRATGTRTPRTRSTGTRSAGTRATGTRSAGTRATGMDDKKDTVTRKRTSSSSASSFSSSASSAGTQHSDETEKSSTSRAPSRRPRRSSVSTETKQTAEVPSSSPADDGRLKRRDFW